MGLTVGACASAVLGSPQSHRVPHDNASLLYDLGCSASPLTRPPVPQCIHLDWQEFRGPRSLFPLVQNHLAEKCSIKAYHILYQEAILCNLLEVLLYHDYAVEACGDLVIELVDFTCRQVNKKSELAAIYFGIVISSNESEYSLNLLTMSADHMVMQTVNGG